LNALAAAISTKFVEIELILIWASLSLDCQRIRAQTALNMWWRINASGNADDGVVKLGGNAIGKLRQDANLRYIYIKDHGVRGRQKTRHARSRPLDHNLPFHAS
jgi:hypothetical protein